MNLFWIVACVLGSLDAQPLHQNGVGTMAGSALSPASVTTSGCIKTGTAGDTLSANCVSGKVGIGTASPATTLDVNDNAQFGSGATKSTFTAHGYWVPRTLTLAQMQATTPSAADIGGRIQISDAAKTYSICIATGATVQGFQLGDGAASGTECK